MISIMIMIIFYKTQSIAGFIILFAPNPTCNPPFSVEHLFRHDEQDFQDLPIIFIHDDS